MSNIKCFTACKQLLPTKSLVHVNKKLLSNANSLTYINSYQSSVNRLASSIITNRREGDEFSSLPLTNNTVFQKQQTDSFIRFNIKNKLILVRNFNTQYRAKRKSIKFKITPLDMKYKMEWPKITLFGDSITRRSMDPENGCWGSMLAYRFGDYFDVDVRGFEGYNTKWALENVEKLFPPSYLEKVELFNIFFGHNDSWMEGFALHVPVDEYEKNMLSIIKYLNENGIENRKITLITPTWFHKEETNRVLAQSRDMNGVILSKELDDARKYSEVVLRIADEKNIDVVDFFEVSLNHPKLEELFCDGIHLSKIGAKLLYELLMPVMEKKLESTFKKSIGDLWHLRPWDQIPEVIEQFTNNKITKK